jgi:signal transduction histidine kinase
MTDSQPKRPARRQSIRREEDRVLRRQLDRYVQLFQVGQIITSEMNFDVLFDVIIEQANRVMDTERCSIFLADDQREQLRMYAATDLQRDEVRIPKSHGVAGWVFSNRVPVIINNAYEDPRFFSGIDRQTGFQTRSILCVPLLDRNGDCIGTMQVLNKKEGDFTDNDREILTYVGGSVSVALENSLFYEQLKASDRAKEKVIHHLAHELKTPLAIITAVLDRIGGILQDHDIINLDKTLARGRRNVHRLMALQEKTEDIIARKDYRSEERYEEIVEDVTGFLEELSEEDLSPNRQIIEQLTRRIQSIFRAEPVRIEKIRLDEFLHQLCSEAFDACSQRDIRLERHITENLTIEMDRDVLRKVCSGLLKNAVENSPDEGLIEISATREEDSVRVDVRDYGVGITRENRNEIFSGFFHTQETAMYSSKRPYQFNAGGTGTDLLRMKIFAQRFGFSIDYESNRCPYLPLDSDTCPGKVSACRAIDGAEDCLASGGTVFTLQFPRAS